MECRICCEVNKNCDSVDIFDKRISNGPMLRFYILLATGVEIKENDLVSKTVCDKCLRETMNMFAFRRKAIKNDKMLKERSGQTYTAPKCIPYDPDLLLFKKPGARNSKEPLKVVAFIDLDEDDQSKLEIKSASPDEEIERVETPTMLKGVGLTTRDKSRDKDKLETTSKEIIEEEPTTKDVEAEEDIPKSTLKKTPKRRKKSFGKKTKNENLIKKTPKTTQNEDQSKKIESGDQSKETDDQSLKRNNEKNEDLSKKTRSMDLATDVNKKNKNADKSKKTNNEDARMITKSEDLGKKGENETDVSMMDFAKKTENEDLNLNLKTSNKNLGRKTKNENLSKITNNEDPSKKTKSEDLVKKSENEDASISKMDVAKKAENEDTSLKIINKDLGKITKSENLSKKTEKKTNNGDLNNIRNSEDQSKKRESKDPCMKTRNMDIPKKSENEDSSIKTKNENVTMKTNNEDPSKIINNEDLRKKSENEDVSMKTRNMNVAKKTKNEESNMKVKNKDLSKKSVNEDPSKITESEGLREKSEDASMKISKVDVAKKSENEDSSLKTITKDLGKKTKNENLSKTTNNEDPSKIINTEDLRKESEIKDASMKTRNLDVAKKTENEDLSIKIKNKDLSKKTNNEGPGKITKSEDLKKKSENKETSMKTGNMDFAKNTKNEDSSLQTKHKDLSKNTVNEDLSKIPDKLEELVNNTNTKIFRPVKEVASEIIFSLASKITRKTSADTKTKSNEPKFQIPTINSVSRKVGCIEKPSSSIEANKLNNDVQIKPHASVKVLFAKYPGLELSKELLLCNFIPYIKLEKLKMTTPAKIQALRSPSTYTAPKTEEEFSENLFIDQEKEDVLDQSLMVVTKQNSVFVCETCNAVFSKRNFLKLHMRVHYVCKLCKRKFRKKLTLDKHLTETCPHLYSRDDFRIEITRCDEVKDLYNRYKSALDVFNKKEETNKMNEDKYNTNVPSKEITEITILNHSETAQQSPKNLKRPILESESSSTKKLKLVLTNSNPESKRPLGDVSGIKSKKPRTYSPNISGIFPIKQEPVDLTNIISNNYSEIIQKQMKEYNFVKHTLNRFNRFRDFSTQVVFSDMLPSAPSQIDKKRIILKNMAKEVKNHHNIPVIINVRSGITDLSARLEKNMNLSKPMECVDLSKIKPKVIKPLGSREHKLPVLVRRNENVIEIDDDDDITEVPIPTPGNNIGPTPPSQMAGNTVGTLRDKPTNLRPILPSQPVSKKPDRPMIVPVTLGYPKLLIQRTTTPQAVGPSNFIYNNGFSGFPMHSVPVNTVRMNSVSVNTVQMNSVPINTVRMSSVPVNTVRMNSVPVNTVRMNSVPVNTVLMNSVPVNTVQMNTVPVNTVQMNSVPVNTVRMNSIPTNSAPMNNTATINNIQLQPSSVNYTLTNRGINIAPGQTTTSNISLASLLDAPLVLNNLLQPVPDNYKTFKLNVSKVHHPGTNLPSNSNKPQIRIKKPSEINMI